MFEDYIFPTAEQHAPELAGFICFFNSQPFDQRRRNLMYLVRKMTFNLDEIMPTASDDERETMFQGLLDLHEELRIEAAKAEGVAS